MQRGTSAEASVLHTIGRKAAATQFHVQSSYTVSHLNLVTRGNAPRGALQVQRGAFQCKHQQHLVHVGNSRILQLAVPRQHIIHHAWEAVKMNSVCCGV